MNSEYFSLKHKNLIFDIFEFANLEGYDAIDFVEKFMNSTFAVECFLLFDLHYINPYSMFKNVIETYTVNKSQNKTPSVVLSYIAFIYVSFFKRTYQQPSKIVKYLPPIYIVEKYDLLHLQNEERVIFDAKLHFNIENNPIRKARSKTNRNFFECSNKKLLYVAKRIYSKLFFYPEIENITYYFESYPYLSNEQMFMVCTNAQKEEDIENVFHLKNSEHYRFNHQNNILAIFIDKENEPKITKFSEKAKICNEIDIPYDKILLITNRYVILLTASQKRQLYFVYSTVDDSKVIQEFENRN